jgi:hypothetical protein
MLQEYYESVGSQLSEDGDGWRRPIKRRILQGRGTGINWVAAWKIDLGAVAQIKALSSLVSFRYVCYANGVLMQHIMFQFPSMDEAHIVETFLHEAKLFCTW